MINFKNIATGWLRTMGIMDTPADVQEISMLRLQKCSECPQAAQGSFLKVIKGSGHNIDSMYCEICKCPVSEKSLVPEENCPLKKWEKLQK